MRWCLVVFFLGVFLASCQLRNSAPLTIQQLSTQPQVFSKFGFSSIRPGRSTSVSLDPAFRRRSNCSIFPKLSLVFRENLIPMGNASFFSSGGLGFVQYNDFGQFSRQNTTFHSNCSGSFRNFFQRKIWREIQSFRKPVHQCPQFNFNRFRSSTSSSKRRSHPPGRPCKRELRLVTIAASILSPVSRFLQRFLLSVTGLARSLVSLPNVILFLASFSVPVFWFLFVLRSVPILTRLLRRGNLFWLLLLVCLLPTVSAMVNRDKVHPTRIGFISATGLTAAAAAAAGLSQESTSRTGKCNGCQKSFSNLATHLRSSNPCCSFSDNQLAVMGYSRCEWCHLPYKVLARHYPSCPKKGLMSTRAWTRPPTAPCRSPRRIEAKALPI